MKEVVIFLIVLSLFCCIIIARIDKVINTLKELESTICFRAELIDAM